MKLGAILFAAAMLAVGIVYETMGLRMPRGSLAYPGPGLFPTLIGAFLIATAAGCLLQELLAIRRRRPAPAPLAPSAEAATPGPRKVGKTFQLIALLAGYGLALKPLGFPLAILIFTLIAIRIFGYRKWAPAAAMAVAIASLSYVAFVVWLKVPLPLGVLEPLLG